MEIRLWGTRGSLPVASPRTARYGGNTTCVEVCTDAGERIIVDAGTGIHALGKALRKETPGRCTICFTHTHWDHVQGLPHFAPLYEAGWEITIMGAAGSGDGMLRAMRDVFDGRHFPLTWNKLPFPPRIREFTPGKSFSLGCARIDTCPTRHPGGCVAYRITADGWSFVVSGDHECGDDPGDAVRERLIHFFSGADVALVDAQYTAEDYATHRGWGHSTMEHWPDAAVSAGVSHLIFTHYDPSYADETLELLLDKMRRTYAVLPLLMQLGYEGMRISRRGGDSPKVEGHAGEAACRLCDFSRRIAQFSDTGTILDSILTEARERSRADAGTVYLVDDDRLTFAYTQNDTLFPGPAANKHLYLNASLPIDTRSIAGYVAATSRPLNLPDVRSLPPNVSYSFNDAFDTATGYRTVSVLTVPFVGNRNRMLGVLQLINCMDHGNPTAFSLHAQRDVERLAVLASHSIERGRMANELILRMLQTAALRDPRETASHVMRVGAMAAEIYRRWAERHKVDPETMRSMKDRIRMAAMLHDVGKVGIPDAVLKKNGRLTPEERIVVEQHSALGARLFKSATWEMDILAHDIALHHHQKWDGTGYTGDPEVPPLSGQDIPLGARITALADVYDALVSRRCYKDAWPEKKAIALVLESSGAHFDPEIVDVFMEIRDIINAIRQRYPDDEDVRF